MPFSIPRPLLYALGALVALVGLYLLIAAYGNARYDAGVSDTDAAWKAAAAKLEAQSAAAAQGAETEAVARQMDWNAKVEAEKERIDDAIASGDSPLDVLFGVRDDKGGGPD